jgi:hypothetical protein
MTEPDVGTHTNVTMERGPHYTATHCIRNAKAPESEVSFIVAVGRDVQPSQRAYLPASVSAVAFSSSSAV